MRWMGYNIVVTFIAEKKGGFFCPILHLNFDRVEQMNTFFKKYLPMILKFAKNQFPISANSLKTDKKKFQSDLATFKTKKCKIILFSVILAIKKNFFV